MLLKFMPGGQFGIVKIIFWVAMHAEPLALERLFWTAVKATISFKPDLRPINDSSDARLFWRLKRGNF